MIEQPESTWRLVTRGMQLTLLRHRSPFARTGTPNPESTIRPEQRRGQNQLKKTFRELAVPDGELQPSNLHSCAPNSTRIVIGRTTTASAGCSEI